MLTTEQEAAVAAVTAAVVDGPPAHFLVEAVAGSGKSRTLVEIVHRVAACGSGVRQRRILCLQFNQDTATRMRDQLATHVADGTVEVHTLHAFGLRLLGAGAVVDPDKAYRCWRRERGAASPPTADEWSAVRRFLDSVRHRGWLPSWSDRRERPLTLAMTVLDAMLADRNTLDLEDGIYHCLYHNVRLAVEYDLVLIDEVQDLNDANHAFLRRIVAPPHARTVVCAVGDRDQAIYQFRGANPRAMDHFRDAFDARPLALTCCFRCPRRVIAVAQHLNRHIVPAPDATPGTVTVRTLRASAWPAEVARAAAAAAAAGSSTLFLARGNATVLEFVRYLATAAAAADTVVMPGHVRWAAPAVAAQLREALGWECPTIEALCAAAEGPDGHDHAPLDRTLLRLVQMAAELDGPDTAPAASRLLTLALDLLDRRFGTAALVLATIHGAKGAECDHVILHQYNLLGGGGTHDATGQDRNLLYIAVTRALRTLTFVLTDSTRGVPSPFLPLDVVYAATDAPPTGKRPRPHDRTYTVPGRPAALTMAAPPPPPPVAIRTT